MLEVQGPLLQYPGRTETNSDKRLLIIGLDFGTAYTKAVIRNGSDTYAVPFQFPVSGIESYLLRGVLSLDKSRTFHLGGKGKTTYDNLKSILLGSNNCSKKYWKRQMALMAAFLSLVIRQIRGWLITEHHAIFSRYYLDWEINVGMPTDSYADNDAFKWLKVAVAAAWEASLKDQITVSCIGKALDQAWSDYHAGEYPDHIGIVPEFVAQIASYVRSPSRREDLHAILDVGAGTVDFTIFNVHQDDGEDVFPIYAKAVKPYGTFSLMRHCCGVNGESQSMLCELEADFDYDEYDRPDDLYMLLSRQVTGCFSKAENHYPTSARWYDGLPMFLCGGGKHWEFYNSFVSDLVNYNNLIQGMANKNITKDDFPELNRLNAPSVLEQSHDRLSVAYGLSFDQFDLGEIIINDDSSRATDFYRQKKEYITNYIGKDMT